VVRGGLAKVCVQAANVLLRVGALVIFARLLGPVDFGLVGMVTAVTGVLGLFKDFGLSTATVQRISVTNEQISTLFWLNLLVGAILGLLGLALAPVLVVFYGEPRLFWVTVAIASGFFFAAAGVQHSALLQRQMRFTTLAIIEILSLLMSTAIGIGMAIAGLGYWALVGWSVTLPAANSLGAWLVAAWLPGWPRRGAGVRPMVGFGGVVTLNILVVHVAYNLDKVLLGRFWGADALGIYGRAYQLISMPTENLIGTIGAVAFPALSRIQDDRKRLKSYFLKGYKLILTMAFPIAIFCALFAEDIVLILLGKNWKDAVSTFRLLSPLIVAFGIINPLGWLLYALGLAGRSLKIALVILPMVTIGFLVGLPYGVNGVAVSFSVMMTFWIVPHVIWCTRGTDISPRELLRVAQRPLLAAVVAAVITYAVQSLLAEWPSHLVRVLLGGSVLLGTYLWLLLAAMGEAPFYRDLIRTLRRESAD
jgi:O-antigen/teichoic acid export membrane protein